VERIVGVFPLADQQAIRTRLGKAFRFIVSQRLLPRKDGQGRIAAVEVLKSTMRTREYVEKGENEGSRCSTAMRDGGHGWNANISTANWTSSSGPGWWF